MKSIHIRVSAIKFLTNVNHGDSSLSIKLCEGLRGREGEREGGGGEEREKKI